MLYMPFVITIVDAGLCIDELHAGAPVPLYPSEILGSFSPERHVAETSPTHS